MWYKPKRTTRWVRRRIATAYGVSVQEICHRLAGKTSAQLSPPTPFLQPRHHSLLDKFPKPPSRAGPSLHIAKVNPAQNPLIGNRAMIIARRGVRGGGFAARRGGQGVDGSEIEGKGNGSGFQFCTAGGCRGGSCRRLAQSVCA
eukprot:603577-Rhodomonas_salina.1